MAKEKPALHECRALIRYSLNSKVWKKIQSNRLKLDWKTLFQFAIRLKYVSPLERLIIISIFWKIDSLSQSYLSKFARAGFAHLLFLRSHGGGSKCFGAPAMIRKRRISYGGYCKTGRLVIYLYIYIYIYFFL